MHALKRQLQDIQIQADRLLKGRPDMEEIEAFADYSDELCDYLMVHINDSFVLEKVGEVPRKEDMKAESSLGYDNISLLVIIFSFGLLAGYARKHYQISKAQKIVRDIKGKFGSIEFLVRNMDA